MRRTLSYTVFATTALIVVAMFVTSKSYEQLGISVALYPLVALFAYKLHIDSSKRNKDVQGTPTVPNELVYAATPPPEPEVDTSDSGENKPEAVDIDKRAFLKIIGATGISYLLFSFLGRRFETPFLGPNENAFQNPANNGNLLSQNSLENYQITEIGYDNLITYYGFVADDGSWIVMKEDSENNSFRYAKGDSDFGRNWDIRETLNYLYYHDLQK